jgi:hypothetical protein
MEPIPKKVGWHLCENLSCLVTPFFDSIRVVGIEREVRTASARFTAIDRQLKEAATDPGRWRAVAQSYANSGRLISSG